MRAVGKLLSAIYDVLAWTWNHVWGALFIGFGLLALFTNVEGVGIWGGLVCIGLGIYFMW